MFHLAQVHYFATVNMRETVSTVCVSRAVAGAGARAGAGGGKRGAGSEGGLQCYGTNVSFTLHIG